MSRRVISALLAACFSTGVWAADAWAYPVHRRMYQAVYGKPTRCGLCHVGDGGSDRNPYGRDWRKAGDALGAFAAVEALDSDGDGLTNREEIDRGSNPGDPKSTPDAPGRRWKRPERVPVPVEQLQLVVGIADRIDALEPTLTPEVIAAIEKKAGSALTLHDRHMTLYFAVEEERRTKLAMFRRVALADGAFMTVLMATDPAGTIQKVALFADDDASGGTALQYLRCLEGKPRATLPAPGADGCPGVKPAALGTRLHEAMQRALWSADLVVRETPDGQADAKAAPSASAAGSAKPAAAPPPLDFNRVKTTTSAPAAGPRQTLYALLVTLVMVGVAALSVRWAEARARPPKRQLRDLDGSARLALLLLIVALLANAAVGAATMALQTRVVNPSAGAYFQALSWTKLAAMSHAHLFGYGVLAAALGLMAAHSSASMRARATVIAAAGWGGVFDVASWWLAKKVSPSFELLTVAAGGAMALGILGAAVLAGRDLMSPGSDPPTEDTTDTPEEEDA